MTEDGHLARNDLFLHRNPRFSGARRLGRFAIAAAALALAGCTGELSSLDPAGPAAQSTALLWWGMFGYFTLVLIFIAVLWFYAMYHDSSELSHQQAQRVQNRWVLWGGLVLPGVSIVAVLAFGLPVVYRMLPTPPENGEAFQVHVTGHQWWFQVTYPEIDVELEDRMVVPAGVPLDIHLTSADVIHAFWVPRLGGKLDMVPGHTNVLRIEATEPGTYRGICAEFCGRDHAHMRFVVEALEPSEFETWREGVQAQ